MLSPAELRGVDGGREIAFFGHDSTESTIIKRVTAFQAHGSHVIGFMFRRARNGPLRAATWGNVELGTTVDRHYLGRLPKLIMGTLKVLRHRGALKRCQIFYARNIDMLLLAVLARRLARTRAVIAYEVLDVQRVFVGTGLVSNFFRWAEGRLLAACDLLVVSSPDFISQYFVPYQKFSGPWQLLENKVVAEQAAEAVQEARGAPRHPPWVIGWFGTLRCVRSLEILCGVADALGGQVVVHIRGRPSEEDLTVEAITAACAGRSNIVYGGPYRSPADLAAIYGPVHFAWCIDYLDAGTNSEWLLPNRLYEGCLMGALALARSGTATARKVEREGLGWTLAEPLEESVVRLIRALDPDTYERKRRGVTGMSRGTFVDVDDTRNLLERLDKLARVPG